MKVNNLIAGINSNISKFNEFNNFNSTLFLLKELFNSFWAYQHLITPNIYNLIEQISGFMHDISRGRKKFNELNSKEIEDMQRKILIFLGFFNKLIKDNTQLNDLELVQEEKLKKSLRPFKLLVVCVANAGRSPVLEQSLDFISESLELKLEIRSCGVFNLMGSQQRERAKQPFLSRIIGRFVSGQGIAVNQELCDWADLILTAAPYISDKIINAFSNANRKVITAKEFVAIYKISEQGFSYGFYIDDPAFSTEREKALDKWLAEKKGNVKDFMIKTKEEIERGIRKPFLYKRKYAEGETTAGEALSIKELLKLSFAIIERLINDSYLTTKPEYNNILLFRLQNLKEQVL